MRVVSALAVAATAKLTSPGPPPCSAVSKLSSAPLARITSCRWLESRFHFSFADYYNPKNMNFGALRVVNDDLVKVRSGQRAPLHSSAWADSVGRHCVISCLVYICCMKCVVCTLCSPALPACSPRPALARTRTPTQRSSATSCRQAPAE